MKHRNPVAVFFLSIITLGIYDLYWLVKTKEVLNKKTKFHTPTIWLLILPAILLIACYIGLFAYGGTVINSNGTTTNIYGSTNAQIGQNTKLAHPGEAIGFLAATVLGWLIFTFISVYWFFKFSKAVNQYTNGKMSTAVTFLILWLIHLIGVALVQDTFNDMS